MKVLARFYVQQITSYAHAPAQKHVQLQAVSRGQENKSWAAATPSGQITMHVNAGDAAQWFADRLGKDVLLTFEATDDNELHPTPYSPS